MARMVAAEQYEPSARFWHFSHLNGSKVYIRGGCTTNFDSKSGRKEVAETIEQFDTDSGIWCKLKTKGTPHPGLTAVACARLFGKYLYTFGGFDAETVSERLHGVLSQLDLETLTWSRLSDETTDGPMRKDACGMVHIESDKLAVFCGYAHPNDPTQSNGGSSDLASTFTQNKHVKDGTGWTNEIHLFDIKKRKQCYHYALWPCR